MSTADIDDLIKKTFYIIPFINFENVLKFNALLIIRLKTNTQLQTNMVNYQYQIS